MQEQYPHRKYAGEHTISNRKRRRKRKSGKWIAWVVLLGAIVSVAVICTVLHFSRNENPLVGTWVYDEHTQYVFETNSRGKLLADDVSYAYIYRINGDKLILDFTENVVRDCEYTFSVDGAKLTLKGGTGTDGGTYSLNKK